MVLTRADHYMINMIEDIRDEGTMDINPRPKYSDGVPAHSIFVNHTFRTYDLSEGDFPICTLRPIAWKTGIKEIFTIYQKPTNVISEMEEMGVTWWGDWDIGDGTIGQRYGATVKHYDLLNRLIEDIKNDPYGRRKVMSMWQEDDLRSGPGLAPCAFMTIWNVRGNFLDMVLIQRSGDMLTASGPGGINETQYAALLMMIARHTGYEPGRFSHFVANEHIYDRHLEQAEIMASRYYKRFEEQVHDDIEEWAWPMLHINPEKTDFYDLTIDDFTMENYESMKPQLKFDLGI